MAPYGAREAATPALPSPRSSLPPAGAAPIPRSAALSDRSATSPQTACLRKLIFRCEDIFDWPLITRCHLKVFIPSPRPMTSDNGSLGAKPSKGFSWELLKLLLVPVIIPLSAWLLNRDIATRDRLQDYFSSIGELAIKAELHRPAGKLKDNPVMRNLARARTMTLLKDLDASEKRKVIAFLANSDLHYQVSLADADLVRADLGGLHLWHVDLRAADLRGASLNKAKLQGASLKDAVVDGRTSLMDVEIDECTVLPVWPKGVAPLLSTKPKQLEARDPGCTRTPK